MVGSYEDLIISMSDVVKESAKVHECNSIMLNWCVVASSTLNRSLACPQRVEEQFGAWKNYADYIFG